MRVLLLCSAVLLFPVTTWANPQCVIEPASSSHSATDKPFANEVGAAFPSPMLLAGDRPTQPSMRSDAAPIPALDHVAAAGAEITDAGMSHGLRVVIAYSDGQFMRLYVAPDGQALVAGLERLGFGSSVLLRVAPCCLRVAPCCAGLLTRW